MARKRIEIDQSNKIEQTERNTVIALSNGVKFSILLKATDKRVLQDEFRSRGEPKNFVIFTFSALIVLLLKFSGIKGKITVDKEYIGSEMIIWDRLVEYTRRLNIDIHDFSVDFKLIGKTSPAHNYASKVTIDGEKPDKQISLKEVMILLFPKKKDRASQRDRGLLNFGLITDDRQPSRSIRRLYTKKGK